MKTISITRETIQEHFTARAGRYDASSRWCTDQVLLARAAALACANGADEVLDVAVGTGLVTKFLRGRVRRITGIDINPEMAAQARPFLDELVLGSAEELQFPDGRFDLVVCRQGIQFMNLGAALPEMMRVLRPGGRVLLIDLCAYGEDDSPEYFEILRLRNPARRNFFSLGDVARLLESHGFERVRTEPYESEEDVDVWSDNGAIEEDRREAIRRVYRDASESFRKVHAVKRVDGRFIDRMLFSLTVGWKA